MSSGLSTSGSDQTHSDALDWTDWFWNICTPGINCTAKPLTGCINYRTEVVHWHIEERDLPLMGSFLKIIWPFYTLASESLFLVSIYFFDILIFSICHKVKQ